MIKQKGFTIVEMLITLTILMLVLALSYQALSVFLNAASKNRSDFSKAQSTSLVRVKLRSSVRGMLDYYVLNSQGHMRPYFFQNDSVIQYISVTPLIFSTEPEVLVTLQVKESDFGNGKQLKILECKLKDRMPYEQNEVHFPINDNCEVLTDKIYAENIELNVERINGSENFLSLPGFTAVEDALTFHLLPKSISIKLYDSKIEQATEWRFQTKIENKRKYFAMDGFDGNA
ncbi:PulJ/GspJ family protein [Pseudoalteromonas sp. SSM20]|uniref:PulJ/GspJ family protein n=1 Tax=Pseudoalteromonas sp. SSM20 TaxID=3139394 RepID=UPI003BA931CA